MIYRAIIGMLLLVLCVGLAGASADTPIQFDFNQLPRQITHDQALSTVPCEDGFADIYPCENVDLVAFVPLADMTAEQTRSADIWGWTDPQNGDEYVIHTLTIGTAFFRIADPENPVFLGLLPTHTDPSNWRDVKVYSDHAYIVSEADEHGLQVFDLTQLRGVTSAQTWTETAHYADFGSAHNIAINEDSGFAYAVGAKGGTGSGSVNAQNCEGGLHMVDISTPTTPINAGCFDEDGYTHDAQCVIYGGPDSDYTGREICFNLNEDTLTIADVTDKSAPVMLSRTPGFSGCVTRTTCYVHQGWLTSDQSYFFVNDELDEQQLGVPTTTYIWNVVDLDAPVLEAEYAPGIPSIDHNLYIRDESAFLSNYTSGLRILNISTPTAPREIGFFDVFPQSDNPIFNGTWSNYPYFESGIVAISSIDYGLFLVRPHEVIIEADTADLVSCANESVTENVSVYAIFDDNNAINLTTTGYPTGVNVQLGDVLLAPGGTTTVSVMDSVNATQNFVLSINGERNGRTTTEMLNVIIGAPMAAVPVAPAALSTDNYSTVVFEWQSVFDAEIYTLEVSDAADFSNIIYTATTSEASLQATGLPDDALLYWRVVANNPCGSTPSAGTPFIVRPTVELCEITYEATFEQSNENWSAILLDGWVNSWTTTTQLAHNGATSWYAPDTSFQLQLLATDTFAVSGDRATFTFWQRRDLDVDGDVGQLLVESGGDFTLVSNSDLSEPYDSTTTFWLSVGLNPSGWSGFQDWTQTSVDVTSYSGKNIALNFLLFSDDVTSNVVGSGWAIDDAQLEICNNTAVTADFSDLPLSYGVAWHEGDGTTRLGSNWDADVFASNDSDLDDVSIPELISNAANEVTIVTSAAGQLQIWFDWNNDGTFSADEQAVAAPVVSGDNIVQFNVPQLNENVTVAYRVRLSDDANLSPTGSATSGEVEDGYVTLAMPTQVALQSQQSVAPASLITLFASLLTVLTLTRIGVNVTLSRPG